MDFDQCPCSGKTLGRLIQPMIMALLAEEPLHGYLLVQRMGQTRMFCHQPPDPTGVYRMLRSMEDDELVTSNWDLGDTGPAKRRFALTPQGRECLAAWTRTLEQYAGAINELLATIKQRGGGAKRSTKKSRKEQCS